MGSTIYPAILLSLLFISAYLKAQISAQEAPIFTFSATCRGLVDYVVPNATTLGGVQALFGIKSLYTLLGANDLPTSTPHKAKVAARETIKIPFPCAYINKTGASNQVPMYTVQAGDSLYHIANDIFSNLASYKRIVDVNDISDVSLIEVGQKLWIPLPCSCDELNGAKVIHYGHVVETGNSVKGIAQKFGTTEEAILTLNSAIADGTPLMAGQLLDVPLKVCSSSVRLQCEAAQLTPTKACPSMKCPNSNLALGKSTADTSCSITTCSYVGFNNQTIFTTLLNLSTTCSGQKRKLKLGVGLAVIFAGIGTLVVMLICCLRKFPSHCSTFFWKKHNHAHQSIETFLNNCGPLQVSRYSYSNIKKMTNSFTEKLGQGGYGSVYKGKLLDGHLVAVKMLNELKANDGEEFINEVAAISRTSHVNVVRLLGFCFEGPKKALIYEYMPNGSLEKFAYNENETEESYQLDWETYYRISLGTARGLEYLHRGCNTRILHFDIKPHNILLDADFVPKISDFGLAKICTRKDSLVSMLGPRGTIGYIAPEVIYRNFGGVSHKSDVYSYGMMILEMVGGRKNANVRADNTSEIYFPQWIYKRLEVEELGLKKIMNEEDNEKARKMIMTSLWCIQTIPSNRPAMSRVIEMLEGSLDSLQVPPKPFLSSPPRSPTSESSNTFVSLDV
ncbi:LEAF RUST 10 DISEASE-RESISTANCE LOCUS RECEPTOR-LIKE PROTEIN KINASE-like 2.1 isoform X2 [Humulus lupulus]|uniref:LEAF RUST 10 DISEASE-RESISTANCE LOCUS RECEPTOR-LIKE PROTEIN KINASE-like 2.1 isoform X2 n=1 Tax=Humulus lupulus TaxID=3486 RepID=UPI002B40E31E|nr:LEAF RUST 10 DISEASE-RESISTANCE LOCUS RECEPTOR-LIKE PROTEIN KINASE-like 2.1 isoform X2 [Humulus lupulus]